MNATPAPAALTAPTAFAAEVVPDRNAVEEAIAKTKAEDRAIARALKILEARLRKPEATLRSPSDAKAYLRLHYAGKEREEFNVLFLDHGGCLLANETLSIGTLDQAGVYPREIAKAALRHNAAAVVLSHNHPSGSSKPSQADRDSTRIVQRALETLGILVLDHMVVGERDVHSFAEHGAI